jgi:hypothetical protein
VQALEEVYEVEGIPLRLMIIPLGETEAADYEQSPNDRELAPEAIDIPEIKVKLPEPQP